MGQPFGKGPMAVQVGGEMPPRRKRQVRAIAKELRAGQEIVCVTGTFASAQKIL